MRVAIVMPLLSLFAAACATHVPEPKNVAPGTAHVSWVIMSGDRDNPDQEFVCQSDPRNDCSLTVSRPDGQVFGHVHLYFHGAGFETRYEGSVTIGFFGDASQSHAFPTAVTVKEDESIMNSSITGIVTSKPGKYTVDIALTARVTDTGKNDPIHVSVPVTVR